MIEVKDSFNSQNFEGALGWALEKESANRLVAFMKKTLPSITCEVHGDIDPETGENNSLTIENHEGSEGTKNYVKVQISACCDPLIATVDARIKLGLFAITGQL